MDAPSPNNNKKMATSGTSSKALAKQGPKKVIIPPTSTLLNFRSKPTSRKPHTKQPFVPSSSKSLMKKPTTFLTMRPTKNLLGASNNNSKSNSLLKKRPTIGALIKRLLFQSPCRQCPLQHHPFLVVAAVAILVEVSCMCVCLLLLNLLIEQIVLYILTQIISPHSSLFT